MKNFGRQSSEESPVPKKKKKEIIKVRYNVTGESRRKKRVKEKPLFIVSPLCALRDLLISFGEVKISNTLLF